MCDAARFIKIEAAAAAKSTALGRAAKRPYKSPNAACPTGWVRQAQTVIRLIKAACLSGGSMGLDRSKQQDLKQCGGSHHAKSQ